MAIDTAIVPVAGLGTRLLPVSLATPKELLPLGQKPALQWILEELGAAGICRVILVTSPGKRNIDRPFRTHPSLEQTLVDRGKTESLDGLWVRSRFAGMQIETVVQDQPLGLGHAIGCARHLIPPDQSVVVALGDCLIGLRGDGVTLQRMLETARHRQAEIVIAFEHVPLSNVSRYGIAVPAETGAVFRLNDLVEKPAPESAPSQLAIAGRYVLSSRIFDVLESTQADASGEIQLTEALRTMIRQNGSAFGVRLPEPTRRYDVGNWSSYLEAFFEFGWADPMLGPMMRKIFAERAGHD